MHIVVIFLMNAATFRWSYAFSNEGGLASWLMDSSKCSTAKQKKQSPIEVWHQDIQVDPTMEDIQLTNYETPVQLVQLNNLGTTVALTIGDKLNLLKISGANLHGAFTLESLLFQWKLEGYNAGHVIGDSQVPLEIQFIHYRHIYPNSTELAIVAVKYELRPEGNPELEKIVTELIELSKMVPLGDSWRLSSSINFLNLMPKLTTSYSEFLRYDGSLTIRPFCEKVKWIVMLNYGTISLDQLNKFRNLMANDRTSINEFMLESNRVVQKLGTRKVFTNTNNYNVPSSPTDGHLATQSERTLNTGSNLTNTMFSSFITVLILKYNL